jgi:DNA-binding PadR family transcriptional regulator
MVNDAQLLVMVSLATGPKHGHAILLDIAGFSARRLGPGTLYGAIEGLERQGLITPGEKQDRRVPYELTGAGRTILHDRLAAIETISRVGAERLRR